MFNSSSAETFSYLAGMYGGEADGHFGKSVSLSASGTICAIGWPGMDKVGVYEYTGDGFSIMGSSISGEVSGDNFGHAVSLSADGLMLIVGAPLNDGIGNNAGRAYIYEYSGSSWILHQQIHALPGYQAGYSVAMSSDGLTVAVAFPYVDNNRGTIDIYRRSSSNAMSWSYVSYIGGSSSGDLMGFSCALSYNGMVAAGGAPGGSFVKVVASSGGSWSQKGSIINGDGLTDEFGSSISLSADGDIIAVGATSGGSNEAGLVKVFGYASGWSQRGSDIEGVTAGDELGSAVALSSDGNRILIGAPKYATSGGGQVKSYDYSDSDWIFAINLYSSETGAQTGYSVAISCDGTMILFGAPYSDRGASDDGRVYLYSATKSSTSCTFLDTSSPTHSPTRLPSRPPTLVPSNSPTKAPTLAPSSAPTAFVTAPSSVPSTAPTLGPTISAQPTYLTTAPTLLPTTAADLYDAIENDFLCDFMSSTNIKSMASKGWTSCDDYSTKCSLPWDGLICDDGVIKTIKFPVSVQGALPSSIGSLVALTKVDMYLHTFHGPVPSSIGSLTNLRFLSLYGCSFTGPVPSFFGSLPGLSMLYLDANSFTGPVPASIVSLTSLTYFSISGNSLTGPVPSAIGSLTGLKILYFQSNSLTGSVPFSFSKLVNLQILELQSNSLIHVFPSELCSMSKLTKFHLTQSSVHECTAPTPVPTPPPTSSPTMKYGSVLCDIIASTNIGNRLDLLGWKCVDRDTVGSDYCLWTGITCGDDSTTSRRRLRGLSSQSNDILKLDLSGMDLVGSIPSSMATMSSLEYLDLSKNSFDGVFPTVIGSWLTVLTTLDLHDNSFSGTIPLSVYSLRKLQLLDLSGNRASGSIGFATRDLTDLTQLNLHGNEFTGTIPSAISALKKLEILSLGSNSFVGTLPSSILGLSNLATLHLENSNVTIAFAQELCDRGVEVDTTAGDGNTCDLYTRAPTIAPTVHLEGSKTKSFFELIIGISSGTVGMAVISAILGKCLKKKDDSKNDGSEGKDAAGKAVESVLEKITKCLCNYASSDEGQERVFECVKEKKAAWCGSKKDTDNEQPTAPRRNCCVLQRCWRDKNKQKVTPSDKQGDDGNSVELYKPTN